MNTPNNQTEANSMKKDNNLIQPTALLALVTAFFLLIPLVGMQFSDEVVWTLSDFIIAGTLLFGTGFMYLLVTRIIAPQKGNKVIYRVAVGFALLTGLFLIWVNLAVGVIGTEDNPANITYFGVIAIGLIGAFSVRFQSERMAYVMFAMAVAQALVAIIALVGGMYQSPPSSVVQIIGVNGFFITLFIISAFLFRYAKQELSATNNDVEN